MISWWDDHLTAYPHDGRVARIMWFCYLLDTKMIIKKFATVPHMNGLHRKRESAGRTKVIISLVQTGFKLPTCSTTGHHCDHYAAVEAGNYNIFLYIDMLLMNLL